VQCTEHRGIAEVVLFVDIQTLWFKKCSVLAENVFWHEIATQGHSICNQLPTDKVQHIVI